MHGSAALDVVTHATCLYFFPRKSRQMAMFVPKSEDSDNPRRVLLKDPHMKAGESLKFIGTNGQERSWITLKRVMHGNTEMYQLAACAWQNLGHGKGERREIEDVYN